LRTTSPILRCGWAASTPLSASPVTRRGITGRSWKSSPRMCARTLLGHLPLPRVPSSPRGGHAMDRSAQTDPQK
jgi:hypothetical protein